MIRTLLALLTFCFVFAGQAQILLDQDFQGFANGGDIPFVEFPDDALPEDWISFDEDGLADGSGGDRPGNWYGSLDFAYFEDSIIVDTNFVMASNSWMDGFEPGNRNWLITPEVTIEDGAILSWASAPFQTPRYADGYSVRISPEGDIDDINTNFETVLWRAAQMVEETGWLEEYYPGVDYAGCVAPAEPDATDVCWFPEVGDGLNGTGYIHANDHTIAEYIATDPADAYPQSYRGFLEPHSIDLSAYAGMTVRIAWVHDSDDDNLISVDDIKVEIVTSVDELAFDQLVNFFPNPAEEALNMNFTSFVKNNAVVNIYDATGKLVINEAVNGSQLRALYTIDVAALETGVYSIQVTVDGEGVVGKNFMKK